MTLAMTFAALAVALFVAFWGGGMFLQTYLYNTPAGRMPLRAAGTAVVVAAFFVAWTYANTRASSKDRFGTFFEFNPTATKDFAEFDAVRRFGLPAADGKAPPEKAVGMKRAAGNKVVEAADPAREFKLTTADYVTVALDIPEGDQKTRFDAELDAAGRYKSAGGKVFRDKSRRYIEFGQGNTPTPIYAPSRGAGFAAVLLNFGNFAVWFLAFWVGMRFTIGPAAGLAAVAGGVTMLILMPLLFEKNALPPAPKVPAAAAKPG